MAVGDLGLAGSLKNYRELMLGWAKVLILFRAMNKNEPSSHDSLPPFETGQVWQMAESTLQIGLIGKTLVHFKHYRGPVKRSPISLLNKRALVKFLKSNRAVLLPPSTMP